MKRREFIMLFGSMRDLVPGVARIAVLVNPADAMDDGDAADYQLVR